MMELPKYDSNASGKSVITWNVIGNGFTPMITRSLKSSFKTSHGSIIQSVREKSIIRSLFSFDH